MGQQESKNTPLPQSAIINADEFYTLSPYVSPTNSRMPTPLTSPVLKKAPDPVIDESDELTRSLVALHNSQTLQDDQEVARVFEHPRVVYPVFQLDCELPEASVTRRSPVTPPPSLVSDDEYFAQSPMLDDTNGNLALHSNRKSATINQPVPDIICAQACDTEDSANSSSDYEVYRKRARKQKKLQKARKKKERLITLVGAGAVTTTILGVASYMMIKKR